MSKIIKDILNKPSLHKDDVKNLLMVKTQEEKALILEHSARVRKKYVGNQLFLRGLVEYSNICRKNCHYCGIRAANKNVDRYSVANNEVLACAKMAWEKGYGSLVIQTGEQTGKDFIQKIANLLAQIKELTRGELGITLSCGEQSYETYKLWFENGAHRYLLRFESANQELYYRIHPDDRLHSFSNRMRALNDLRAIGYQVGSGMMIGLPGQTIDALVEDLFLLKKLDVDMVGMGPYIEHPDTPLFRFKHLLISKEERLDLSILVIAVLRILMKDINIASATALDSLHPKGREKAIAAGANVLMPNLTPVHYRENYFLYDNKPYLTEADELINQLSSADSLKEFSIAYKLWGDSKHFYK